MNYNHYVDEVLKMGQPYNQRKQETKLTKKLI